MASVTQLKDGRWICQYVSAGKKKREYFGRGAAAQTLAYNRKREIEVCTQELAREEIVFLQLADAYLQSRLDMPQKGKVNLWYRFRSVIGPHIGALPISQLTHDRLDQYVRDRRVEKRVSVNSKTGAVRKYGTPSQVTIHDELTDIMTVLNWAAYERKPPIVTDHPCPKYKKIKRTSEPIKPPTEEEVNALLANAAPHLVRIIMLAVFCGYRPGPKEMFSAKWELVDLGNNIITVVSAQKGGLVKRDVPIHPQLKEAMLSWHNQDAEIDMQYIIHHKGKPIQSIKRAWREAKRRAGITRRMRPYDLRHLFATELLQNGAPVKTVSELMGHANPQITLSTYAHVSHRSKVDAIMGLKNIGISGNPKQDTRDKKKIVSIGG